MKLEPYHDAFSLYEHHPYQFEQKFMVLSLSLEKVRAGDGKTVFCFVKAVDVVSGMFVIRFELF